MGRSVTFTSPDVPAHVIELLGPAPLLKGENLKQYQALLSEIARTVKPADIMEWLWVKDIVDLTWDILRYRRLKANGIQNTGLEATCLNYTSTASALAALHLIEQMQASAELRRNNAAATSPLSPLRPNSSCDASVLPASHWCLNFSLTGIPLMQVGRAR